MTAMTGLAEENGSTVLARAIAGDEVAFARIVEAHHETMRRVCVIVSGDEAIADDAVGAAWPIAWRKLNQVRAPERLRAWLVSVAVNEARQLMRSTRRRTIVELSVESGRVDPRTGDPASRISGLDLRNALARLDPTDRALLAMRYVAGFDATELSRATGLSPSGTRARLQRLLSRLERDLRDE